MRKKTSRKLKLTTEQLQAVELARLGNALCLVAFAGAAKTTTLIEIAKVRRAQGIYLAFNRRIAESVQSKLPKGCESRTIHSLAYRAVGHRFRERLKGGKRTVKAAAAELDLDLKASTLCAPLPNWATLQLILGTIRAFTHDDSPVIGPHHASLPAGLQFRFRDQPGAVEGIQTAIAEQAERLWRLLLTQDCDLPIEHDDYLKLWFLEGAIIEKDYFLVDEAQDLNPVMLAILREQDGQLIMVGDRFQAIYGFRGAVNAMQDAPETETAYLTHCFRFGTTIAEQANKVLCYHPDYSGPKLIGAGPTDGQVFFEGRPKNLPFTAIYRTNGGCVTEIVDSDRAGLRFHGVGMDGVIDELWAIDDLMRTRATRHPKYATFSSFSELVDFSETPEGREFITLVRLCQQHEPRKLARLLGRGVDEREAEIIVSTVHKAKGLEWDTVVVGNDFFFDEQRAKPRPAEEKEELIAEEINVRYVAVTRAKESLYLLPARQNGRAHGNRSTAKGPDDSHAAPQSPRGMV